MLDTPERDETQQFLAAVRAWISEHLPTVTTFGTLLRALPGVDPIHVVAALAEIAATSEPGGQRAQRLGDEAATLPATVAFTAERPVPHPLEFYWAYTTGTVESIIERLRTFTSPGDTVAYLGTPNVYSAALSSLPDRDNVLFDRSVPRTERLRKLPGGRVLQVDLLASPLPRLSAQAAVLDPPWYPDLMRGFLWAAGNLTASGGIALAAFPPPGTRPGVEAEKRRILEWAAYGGLRSVEYEPGWLRYRSAPFELASHRAAGLGGVPLDWRSGDLATLRLDGLFSQPRPQMSHSAHREVWLPFSINEIPIWIRHRRHSSEVADRQLLEEVIEGGTLTSVSSRDPVRHRIDIWTSLSRVWSSASPRIIEALCRGLAEGTDPDITVQQELRRPLSRTESDRLSAAVEVLSEVVKSERRQHGL
jgi:hypothetical protein